MCNKKAVTSQLPPSYFGMDNLFSRKQVIHPDIYYQKEINKYDTATKLPGSLYDSGI